MERFFGGNPLAVTLRLVIISIVAGIALNAAGYNPQELPRMIADLIKAIYDMGFSWVERGFNFFILGAIVVVPIWFLLRFLKFITGDAGKDNAKPRS